MFIPLSTEMVLDLGEVGKSQWRSGKFLLACLWFASVFLFVSRHTGAQVLTPIEVLTLSGDVAQPDELSGIALLANKIIVAPDEEASFNVLKRIALAHLKRRTQLSCYLMTTQKLISKARPVTANMSTWSGHMVWHAKPSKIREPIKTISRR